MSKTESFFGNGVGLSIVDSNRKTLNGTIDFDSVADEGTTIYLTFPTDLLD